MTTKPPLLPVSEAAREAAALLQIDLFNDDWNAQQMRLGRADGTALVQAFARFEAAVQSPPAASQDGAGMREALEVILGNGKAGTWKECVEPLVARFDVAANFGGDAVHNPDGSRALAELLRSMAERLDLSVERARAALHQGELQQASVGERAGEGGSLGANAGVRLIEALCEGMDLVRAWMPDNHYRAKWLAKAESAAALSTPAPADKAEGLREAVGWQPIETAPKDGRQVMLADRAEQWVTQAYWCVDSEMWVKANEHYTDAHDVELRYMTHWMPLPAPPAALSGSIEGKGDGE